MEKADELEEELAADEKVLERLKTEVCVAIDELEEPSELLLLHYRYVMFKTMPEIAVAMHYSLRWTKRLHSRALEEFERSHPYATPKPLPDHGHHAL